MVVNVDYSCIANDFIDFGLTPVVLEVPTFEKPFFPDEAEPVNRFDDCAESKKLFLRISPTFFYCN